MLYFPLEGEREREREKQLCMLNKSQTQKFIIPEFGTRKLLRFPWENNAN